jgi:glucan-binding YG repeat protein
MMKIPNNAIKNYINYKKKIQSATFVINSQGEGYYLEGENKILEAEWKKDNPEPYLREGKGLQPNSDRRKNFMADVKSY